MDAPYSPLEFDLLNAWQHEFPLVERPFAAIAEKVSAGETAVLDAIRRLAGRGAISRVGAVFAPRRVGAGTLAAVAAPSERLEQVAQQISGFAAVNHNYQREHDYNLWFVATAADQAALQQVLQDVSCDTGCPVIAMPLAEEFHIDLGFDLGSGHSTRRRAATAFQPRQLDADERRLAACLQEGLALVAEPYAELAQRAALPVTTVLRLLQTWCEEGLVKRFGVVVRHHELGYRANAMVVFDVPDARASEVGQRLAKEAGVTLCYRRERCLPQWHYNLYCMVHGRSRADVEPVVARLAAAAGVPATVLFSVRRFKQCGARYF